MSDPNFKPREPLPGNSTSTTMLECRSCRYVILPGDPPKHHDSCALTVDGQAYRRLYGIED